MKSIKTDWFDRHRMLTVGIFLLIVWFSLLGLFFLKADEITKNPCSICAEKHGDEVLCTTSGLNPISISYLANGSVINSVSLLNVNHAKDI